MFSFSYIWPIALVVFSNVLYQVCAKSVPAKMNPYASLTITYLVGALVSGLKSFASLSTAESGPDACYQTSTNSI